MIDPSSPVADQELRKTVEMIGEEPSHRCGARTARDPNDPAIGRTAAEIKPLSRAPINLKMSEDAKKVFDTIGKLAGLTVIYDRLPCPGITWN